MINIILFILLVLLSYCLQKNNTNCYSKKKSTYIYNFIHHIISVYGIFGSILFKNYLFHLISIFSIMILWQLYNNRCPLTLIYNKDCNINIDIGFYDIIKYLSEKINIPLRYPILIGIIIYDIINLYLDYK